MPSFQLTAPTLPIRPKHFNLRQRLALASLPVVMFTSVITSWTPLVRVAHAATACNDSSSWGVKVGSDAAATQINLNAPPTPITVFQLANIPLPNPVNHRVSPTEKTVYKTTAIMSPGEPHIEHDADTHIAFNDGTPGPGSYPFLPGHYAIAEIPDINLGPVPACSVFYAGIVRAHQQLDAWTAASSRGPIPATVVITGVGFFDGNTSQADQSPNQIELHAVLNLNINPGTITGQLTSSGGGAISGATVSDGVDPAVLTNSNGSYTIPEVAAGASYTVTASANGYNSQSRTGIAIGYATASTQNFSLTPTPGTFTGTVTSASGGAAISGATVTDAGGASATANGSGVYTLTGLSAGSHTLTATAAGYSSQAQTATVASGSTQNLSFSLTPALTTGSVTGTITSASGGAAVAGASVTDSGGGSTSTNGSGVYTLTGLSPGSHTLTASGASFTAQAKTATVTAGGSTQGVNFNLAVAPGSVTGTITSASGGAAIAGATVSDGSGASATTNGSGVYTLSGLAAGNHSLTASATDFASQSQTASIIAGQTTQNVNFSLTVAAAPTGAIGGTVTSASGGAAVAGATVSDSGGATTTTDGSGAYALGGLAPGSHTLTTSAAGFTSLAKTATVTSGTTQTLNFSLISAPTTGAVTGTVTNATGGATIAGATVTDPGGASATTNGSGVYTLTGLTPGNHTLTASAIGFSSLAKTASIVAGQTTQNVGFGLTALPGAVTGTVTSATGGAAIAGATVTDSGGGGSATANSSGVYTLSGLTPGNHNLTASASGFNTATQTGAVTSGNTQTVSFSLVPSSTSGAVSGTVISATAGTPIAGATVSDNAGTSASTNASGVYTLAGLSPGSHTLTASAAGFNPQAQTTTIIAGNTQSVGFSLASTPTGGVTGTVTSASGGAAISGATVTDSTGPVATTSATGVYTLSGLAPGSHTLTASAAGFTSSSQAVSISAGTTQTLSFTLTPLQTGALSGIVTNASGGAAVAGATVSDSSGANTTTDVSGLYTLTGLAPGSHTLTTAAAGFGSKTVTATVVANTTTTGVNFSLTPSPTGAVTGTLTSGSSGAPIVGATVSDGGGTSTTTNASGVYTFSGLPPGSHTLTAAAAGFTSGTETTSVIAGSTQTVDFSLTSSPTTGAVTGTVTSATGGAVIAGATVIDSGGASVLTDSTGAYTMTGLTPGSHTLTASAPGFNPQTQTASVTAGNTSQSISFRLSPPTTTGAATGTVTSASGGAPVSGATVTDSGGTSTTTNASGVYTLTGLVAGSHTLTVAASGFNTVAQTATINAGNTQNVSFSLTPIPTTGAVTGTVTNASGGAFITGATVKDAGGATTTTDASGVYTLSGISAGSHTLTASAGGFNSGTQTASVTVGQTTQSVNFSLTPVPPGATPQLVQSAGASETVTATLLTATFPTATVAGNLLVLSASLYSGSTNHITSITDSGGNTWTNVGAYFTSAHFSDGEMWYSANAKSDTNVVIHMTTAVAASMSVQEFSGVATTSPLDVSIGTSNTSNAPSSGAVTPTTATDLMVGFIAGHANAQAITVTPAIGYTAQAQQTSSNAGATVASVVTGYKVLTAASAQTFTGSYTTAMYWASGIAAFKSASGTSGAVTGTVTSASGGGAVSGATVSDSGGASTTTNSSGGYTLTGLNAGSHTLTTTAVGFNSGTQTATVTVGQTTTGVNFSLTPASTTGAVSGTVTSVSSGATIAGATVTDSGGASTTTNASGVYTLTALAPGSHTLTASATGFNPGTQTASVTAGQTAQNINFSLTSSSTTGAVIGTVTSASGGAAIAGATVTDSAGTATTTNASGAYSLTGLAPGSHTVTVDAAGFTSQAQTRSVTAGTTQTAGFSLTPTPSTGAVSGTVTNATGGTAISGAAVTDSGSGLSTTTNASGAYTMSGLIPGSHTLIASATGFTSQTQTAPVTSGSTQSVSYSLTPAPTTGAVAGIVTSASGGAIIAGATISDSGGAGTTTDINGAFSLTGLAPGSHTLTATATGFNTQVQTASVTAGNSQSASFSLTPSPTTGAVTGKVVSALGGAAVPGATVTDGGGAGTVADASGTYTLTGLIPGSHNLTASAANFVTSQPQAVSITAGGTNQGINFSLTPTGSVTGTVTDSSGGAIAGATVTDSTVAPPPSTTTDGSGVYTLSGLAPGSHTLTASATNFITSQPQTVSVTAAGTTTGINFSLTPSPGSVTGVVSNATGGAAVAGATVTDSAGGTPATTNANGVYTMTGLAPGGHNFTASALNFITSSPQTVSVPAGGTASGVNFSLTPSPGSVTGTVRNATDGTVVAGASVSDSGGGAAVTTDANGIYTLSGLTPGSHTLGASATNFISGTTAATVTAGGTTTGTDFSLTPSPGAVTGTVSRSSGGALIAGATVTDSGGTSTTTDANGVYTLTGLIPGNHSLTASATSFVTSQPLTVSVAAGGTTQGANFSLTPTNGAVTGKVTNNWGGAAVAGATVSDSGGGAPATTDANGVYTLSGLTPGSHTLTAAASGFTSGNVPASVTSDTTTTGVDFSLAPTTGSVIGYVTSAANGTAIAGATVSDSAGTSTTSDGSGLYTLTNLAPGNHTLTASATDFTTQSQPASVSAGQATGVYFSLTPLPGTVTGTVTSSAGGSAISGATVSDNGGPTATTDASGTYTITLTPGSHQLTASAGTFATSAAQTASVTPGSTISGFNFSLTPLPGAVSGTVTSSPGGSPISGATVTDSGGTSTTTDALGAYLLSGLTPGSHTLTASATGFSTPAPRTVSLTAAATTSGVDFSLSLLPGAVSGVVTSSVDGSAVAGATVTDNGGPSTTTDAAGTYTLNGLTPGSHDLTASATGFVSATQTIVVITAQTTSGVNFSLTPTTGVVSGTVTRTTDGAAVAGATVTESGGASTTTNSAGVYTLTGLAPGSATLTASAGGYTDSAPQAASVSVGVTTAGVDFSLAPLPGAVTGTVTNAADGTAIAGATVSDSGGATPTTTDANGAYTLTGLTPGSHTVTVSAVGFTTLQNTASVGAGQTIQGFNFSLTPLPGAVSGTVTSAADGTAISGATVADGSGASATTDGSGAYTLSGLTPGSHTLTASAAGFTSQPQPASVTADQTTSGVNFSLAAAPGAVSGTVTNASGGAAIAGATVTDGNGASGTTDGSGSYTLSGLTPGSYTLTATAPSFSGSQPQTVSVSAGQTTTGVNFSLTPLPGAVTGTVTSASGGAAIAGATVSDSAGGTPATTDANGAYTLTGLTPGNHTLTATATSFTTSQPQTAVVNAGQTTQGVNFSLAPLPGAVSGTVTNASGGAAISGATVTDGGGASTTTDGSGVYTLGGLTPGSHTLTASAGTFSSSQPQAALIGSDQTTTGVNFSLTALPGAVSGTVTSASGGAAIVGATVTDSSGATTTTNGSGTYSLGGLAPGSHTLTASAGSFINSQQTTVVNAAQTTTGVNFSLTPLPGAVTGTVTSASGGAVIAGATVTDSGGASATTNGSGVYSLNGLSPGSHSLSASAASFTTSQPQTAVVNPGQTTQGVNFSLTPLPGAVTGTVTSATGGAAIAGATITDSGGASAVTDGSGVYTLSALIPGSHSLTTSATNFTTSQSQSASVSSGQTTSGVDFSLTPAPGSVTGTVTNASGGAAISGATVTDSGGASTTTNASGTYSLTGLTPGSHTLTASAASFTTSQPQTTVVNAGQTTTGFDFSLTPLPGAVTGTVTSASGGAAISGASVTDSGGTSATTDANGVYTLSGLAPGSHTLTASASSFTSSQPVAASVNAGQTTQGVNFSLTPLPGSATGTVTSASGGAAISGATVTDSGGASAITNATGVYTLGGLTPGNHSLTTSAANFTTSPLQTVTISAGQTTSGVDFSLTPAPGSVSGTVTNASGGAAISGATVTDSGGASTTTNASGSYTLSGLAPGSHSLTTAATNFTTSQPQSAVVNAGQATTGVNFSLTPLPGAVTGTVTSASGGVAIAGATVTDSAGGTPATTDANGVYTLSGLTPGSHTLTASATNFTSSQPQAAVVNAGQTTSGANFSLTPLPGAVSGTVTSATGGAAIAGATVTDSGGASAITDGSGVYTLSGLTPGSHNLTTSATNFTTSPPQAAVVTTNQTTSGVNFSLRPAPGAVSGTVTNASGGATIAGATVTDSGGASTTTSASGTYTLSGLTPGNHTLTASAGTFTTSQPQAAVVNAGQTTVEINFSLTPLPGAVTGTVTSASGGAAISGASVSDSGGGTPAITDANGVYTLSGLTPGSHTLTASATGFTSGTQTAAVNAGQTTQGTSFSLALLPGAVSGTVTSASGGAAVAGATVTDSGGASAVTDASGVYTLGGLTPGSHTLTTSATNFTTSPPQTASVTTNQTTSGVNFSLAPAPGSVSGTVTNASGGAAIAGATVTDSGGASTTTNASGVYILGGLTPGSHTLTASAASFTSSPPQTSVVSAGQTTSGANFSLTPLPGAVTGTVTSASGGAAISGATVSDSGGGTPATTDANGLYTLTGLTPGSHTLTASATGFTSGTQTALVNAGQTTQGANFSLSLLPGAVSGTVTNASGGAAIAGATVADSGGASAVTNASGAYILSGLTPGSHTLTASASGYATSPPQTATVTTGQTTTGVNFSLTSTVSSTPQFVKGAGASETTAATSLTATFATPTSAGRLLVLSASVYSGATSHIASVTDSGGNTWTRIGAFFVSGHNSDGEMWYAANANSVSSVVIHTTTAVVASMAVQEFSGITTTSPLDVSAGTANTSTAATSGAVTPTASSELIVGFVAGHAKAQVMTVGAGYAAQAQQSSGTGSTIASVVTGYKVLSSASAQTFTGSFATAMYWSAGIAGFKSGTSQPPTTGGVSGTVTSASGGAAISGATVTDNGGASTTTNASGAYTLAGLTPGSHTLTSSATGFTSSQGQAASVTAGITTPGINFSLAPLPTTGAVTGTVTSASGGAVIAGATVRDSGGATATTNGSGVYTLSGLTAGNRSLTASAAGFTTSSPQTASVTAGQTTQGINFALASSPTTGAVSGTITSASGGAVIAGATVTDSGGTSTTTNGSGVYTLTGLTAGSHTLTAAATGFTTSPPQTATVTASQTTSGVNFSLTPTPTTGAVTGTVTRTTGGTAISGATVIDSGGLSTTTNASGVYTLAGLSAGNHTLTASAAGFTAKAQTAAVTIGQTTQGVNFSLATAVGGSPKLVQASGATETVASTSLTANFAAPTATGHLLVLSASVYSGATSHITSVTDSGGNTWTRIGAYFVSGHNSNGEMWYAANAKAATSVVVNTTNAVIASAAVQEFSGISTTAPLDVSAGTSNTSTAASSGPVTPTAATDLVVGFVAGHANAQAVSLAGNGFTAQAQQTSSGPSPSIGSVVTGYKVLTTAGAQTFTGSFTSAMYWAAGIVAFKAGP